MRIFKEYFLNDSELSDQNVYLPHEAEAVNVAKTNKGVSLVVIAPHAGYTNGIPEIRVFKICSTDEIFYADTVKYIGSYEGEFGLRHVIEVKRSY